MKHPIKSPNHVVSPSFERCGPKLQACIFATLLFIIASILSNVHASDLYITVIDLSGSMNQQVDGGKSRLGLVKEAVSTNIRDLPEDATLTLIGFNRGIVSEVSGLPLADGAGRERALDWIGGLVAPENSKTYLWTTMDRALELARVRHLEDPTTSIFIRCLTDGDDNEGVTDFGSVIKKYPEVDGETLHVDFLTLGIELSIPPKKGVTVTPISDWNDIFPPVIHLHPAHPRAGEEIGFFFKSKSTYDRVEWWVDGEIRSEDPEMVLPAPSEGPFEVTLKAYRQNGVRTATVRVPVSPPELRADFTIVPEDASVGDELHFIGKSHGKIGSTKYQVFGETGGALFESSEPDSLFRPGQPGKFRIVLTAWDESGIHSDQLEKSVEVRPALLRAAIQLLPEEIRSGEGVRVIDESAGSVKKRMIDFGDGSPLSAEAAGVHIYEIEGEEAREFTVTLTIEDEFGRTETATKAVRVLPAIRPRALFSIADAPETRLTGAPIRFLNESESYHSCLWTINGEEASRERNPALIFENIGPVVVSLHVEDENGKHSDQYEEEIQILPRFVEPKIVEITATRLRGRIPFEAQFIAVTTGDIDKIQWSLPGNKTATGKTVDLYLNEAGDYRLTVEATGKGGTRSVSTSEVEIVVLPPLSKWVTVGPFVLLAGLILLFSVRYVMRRIQEDRLVGTLSVRNEHGEETKHVLTGKKEFPLDPLGAPGYSIRTSAESGPALYRGDRRIKNLQPSREERAGTLSFRYLRS